MRGNKTVTRRDWKDKYAAQWKKGDVFAGVSKLRSKDAQLLGFATIAEDLYKQPLRDMPDDHFYREGGNEYWSDLDEFVRIMGGYDKEFWVIEFARCDRYGTINVGHGKDKPEYNEQTGKIEMVKDVWIKPPEISERDLMLFKHGML